MTEFDGLRDLKLSAVASAHELMKWKQNLNYFIFQVITFRSARQHKLIDELPYHPTNDTILSTIMHKKLMGYLIGELALLELSSHNAEAVTKRSTQFLLQYVAWKGTKRVEYPDF